MRYAYNYLNAQPSNKCGKKDDNEVNREKKKAAG